MVMQRTKRTVTAVSQHMRDTLTYVLARLHAAAAEGSVPVGPLQQRQHRLGVQLPPHEQVVGVQLPLVGGQRVTSDLAALSVVGVTPRLHLAQEVHDFGVTAVPAEGKEGVRREERVEELLHRICSKHTSNLGCIINTISINIVVIFHTGKLQHPPQGRLVLAA